MRKRRPFPIKFKGDLAMYRTLLLVVVFALFCAPGLAQNANTSNTASFSAVGQFSTTSNPNGTWSYGYSTTLGGPFSLYTIQGTTFFSNEVGWFGPFPNCCSPGSPLVVVTQAGPPQVLDMLPGAGGQLSVVRWTAPTNGGWDIVGEFFGTGATSVDVHVLRNSSPIFDRILNNSDVQSFSLTLKLAAGDTIDFAVGVGADGSNSFDSTGFKAVIAPFSFTTIDFPGATRTRAVGLNDHGDIVGDYRDSSGVFHGYLLSHGNFTTFDPPGSIQTRGLAINNLGVIGGTFLDSSNARHSYLLNHGAFTIFDFPGATATFLQGINDLGQVVGTYIDSAGNTHGFLRTAGNFTTIDFPGAVQGTVAGGINDRGQIVGNFGDASGITHGFLLSGGNLSTIDFPGALDTTAPFGISANGEIVGFYDDSNGVLHGFTLIAGNFSTVDFPGGFNTLAFRVNEAGQIVGRYNLSGQHGFLATPSLIGKP